MVIYTVGHGDRTPEDLVETLRGGSVEKLADVRRYPGSRRHPHFVREALSAWLPETGIEYLFRGQELGGRRRPVEPSRHPAWRNPSFRAYADYMDTDAFQAALRQLEEEAARGAPLAIMCAERLWWQCHRRLIADALTVAGVEVVHLLSPSTRQAHVLNPDARVDERGLLVYDKNTQGQLPIG